MPAWDLVIFDNDGVLVDSERLGNRVLSDLLTECGHGISFDDCVRHFMGRPLARVRTMVEAESGARLPDDFEDRYLQAVFAVFRSSLRPVAGVQAVLEELQQSGTPVCVASSARHEKIRMSLGTAGLLHHFVGRSFSAVDVERGKPAPDLFLHAAAECGAVPQSCVVVEDSPAGIRGGKAAGMAVVGYTGGGLVPAGELTAAGADLLVESMDVLLDALERLLPDGAAPTPGSPPGE